MNHQIITYPKITIIGPSIKTTNQEGQSQKDITSLWDRFFEKNLIEKIPNKINNKIIGAYTDYEGDFTKPYTFITGCMVNDATIAPEGMIIKEIPESIYATFNVSEFSPKAILETWKQIWSTNLNRSYTTDFEMYSPCENNPKNVNVSIYIAINKD